jgi:PTS system beta-glucosides-specific IIC component
VLPAYGQVTVKYGKDVAFMGVFQKLFGRNTDAFYAPMAGKAVPITEVPDPTFAEGMLGNGIAIEPVEGKVYAPCDASVDMMFPTGHAVSLISDNGIEILIHVGLETVGLNGAPFQVKVQNGQKVKKGQLLIEVDLEAVKAAGLPTITPMLICNTDDYPTFNTFVGKDVTNEDVVIALAK